MKDQADKLFADKLSSLDNLPDGYSPNIDSKWAIIHGSVTSGKAVNYKLRIGIAACLLLLFISGILLLKINAPTTVIVETQNPAEKISPSDKIKVADKKEVEDVNRVAQQVPLQKKNHGHSMQRQIEKVGGEIDNNNSETAETEINNPQTIGQDMESVTNNVAMTVPQQVNKNRRYVEVDFSDPVQQSRPVANEKNPFTVKINFSFRKDNFSSEKSVSTQPLRLHQNF